MDRAKITSEIIEEMNHERERAFRQEMRRHLDAIIAQQDIIKKATTQIASLKQAMANLSYEPVNAAEIVS